MAAIDITSGTAIKRVLKYKPHLPRIGWIEPAFPVDPSQEPTTLPVRRDPNISNALGGQESLTLIIAVAYSSELLAKKSNVGEKRPDTAAVALRKESTQAVTGHPVAG